MEEEQAHENSIRFVASVHPDLPPRLPGDVVGGHRGGGNHRRDTPRRYAAGLE